jgi:hypothetical protein
MGVNKKEELISLKEAAHILGYQQNTPILNLIKRKYLKVKRKKNSDRMWLQKNDVLNLPKLTTVLKLKNGENDQNQWVI